jgi:hypothetical protein
MREFIRTLVTALSVVCLAPSFAVISTSGALAQAQGVQQGAAPPPFKHIVLTDKHIEGVLAAAYEMYAITSKLPEDAKPDPKVMAQLEAVAKTNGFASYDEYNNVIDNITIVMGGFDPESKKYVGPEVIDDRSEAVIKSHIAQVQADKKMSAKDKQDALAELNQALKAPEPPIDNTGNIALVARYYDRLVAIAADDRDSD